MAKKKRQVVKPANKKGLVPVTIKKHRDKNGGHNHIIMEDIGNKHVSVGLTTRETKGKSSTHKNYKCEVDPLGSNKESYMRRQGIVDHRKNYEDKEKRGAMHPNDYVKAKQIAEKAKQKYTNEKTAKKK